MDSRQAIAQIKRHPVAVVGFIVTLGLAGLYYFRMPVLPELRTEFDKYSKEAEQIRKNSENAVELEEHLQRANQLVSEIEGWDLRLVSESELPEKGIQEIVIQRNASSNLMIRIFEPDGSYEDWDEAQLVAEDDVLQEFKNYMSEGKLWDKKTLSAAEAKYIRDSVASYTKHTRVKGRLMDFEATIANTGYFLRLKKETGVEFSGGNPPKPTYFDVDITNKKGKSKATKIYAQMEYKLKLVGALPNILNFIYRLKTEHYFFVVDSVSFTANNQSSESDETVIASVSARVLAKSKSGKE